MNRPRAETVKHSAASSGSQGHGLIADDDSVSGDEESRLVDAILEVFDHPGPNSEKMSPMLQVRFNDRSQTVEVTGRAMLNRSTQT